MAAEISCWGALIPIDAGFLGAVAGAGVGCWGPSLGIGKFLACAIKSIA